MKLKLSLVVISLIAISISGCSSSSSEQEQPIGLQPVEVSTPTEAINAIAAVNTINASSTGEVSSNDKSSSSTSSKSYNRSSEYINVTEYCEVSGAIHIVGTKEENGGFDAKFTYQGCEDNKGYIERGVLERNETISSKGDVVGYDLYKDRKTISSNREEILNGTGIEEFNTYNWNGDKDTYIEATLKYIVFDPADTGTIEYKNYVVEDNPGNINIINGQMSIESSLNTCTNGTYEIKTITQLVKAGSIYSSGEMSINGASYIFNSDGTADVTFTDGTSTTINQNTPVKCDIAPEDTYVDNGDGTITSPTGRIWMDRNIGASQACTAFNDTSCYGDHYQWGRSADGHEDINSETTSEQATNLLNVGHGKFITVSNDSGFEYDWAHDLDEYGKIRKAEWEKTDGTSICPVGFRVPTYTEIIDENILDKYDAFIKLKLPSAGYHNRSDGSWSFYTGTGGFIWASSIGYEGDSSQSEAYYFGNNEHGMHYGFRANGLSVRCIKN